MLDSFAALGVPVTATEAEMYRLYTFISEILSFDRFQTRSEKSKLFAQQRLELVHQSFDELIDLGRRGEAFEEMYHRARSRPSPETAIARALKRFHDSVEICYEAAVQDFAVLQYRSRNNAELITSQLSNLNLVYLSLGIDDGGQSVSVPRSPHPTLPTFGAEPDQGVSLIP